jgi:predicted RecA/RadA family phage recombinase
MALEAILALIAGAVDYTPSADATAGEVRQLADLRAGILAADTPSGKVGSLYTEGIFDVLAGTAVTFLIGESVWWDASANTAINGVDAGVDDFFVGYATKAKVSGDLSVRTDINGVSKPRLLKTVSAAVTLGVSDLDGVILGDTQAGAFSITLPAAAVCVGRQYTFVRAGSGTNALTIDANSTELINGAQTHATMDALYDTITIVSIGTAWRVISSVVA